MRLVKREFESRRKITEHVWNGFFDDERVSLLLESLRCYKINITADQQQSISENEDALAHLEYASEYMDWSQSKTQGINRLNPFYFSHGRRGYEDTKHYAQAIIDAPKNCERETIQFLSGGITLRPSGAQRPRSYLTTTGEKFRSRRFFFRNFPHILKVSERLSLKSIAQHPATKIALAVLVIVASHGTAIPVVTGMLLSMKGAMSGSAIAATAVAAATPPSAALLVSCGWRLLQLAISETEAVLRPRALFLMPF